MTRSVVVRFWVPSIAVSGALLGVILITLSMKVRILSIQEH